MKISYLEDADCVQSLMLSVELAIALNPGKSKDRLVQKVCTHARHRMSPNLKAIVMHWRTLPDAYTHYDRFMTTAGL